MDMRNLLKAGVVAIVAALGVAVAHAAEVTVTDADGSGANSSLGFTTVYSPLFDVSAVINAAVSGANTGQTVNADPGTPTGTTTVTANTIAALATGNSNVTSVDVATLGPLGGPTGDPTTDGIGVLDYSLNSDSTITSSVETSSFIQDLSDLTVGAASNSSNTMTAQTTLNTQTSNVSGQVPLTYTSDTSGVSTVDFGGSPVFDETGSVAVFNGQLNSASGAEAGSEAVLDDNTISQLIENTTAAAEIVTSSPDVSSNTLSALFTGNSADNTISLETGANVVFEGSLALTNGQANFDTSAGAAVVATNTSSRIAGTVTASGAGSETLSGTLTVDNNTISSSAIGNSALTQSGASTSGNTITIADGLDFTGTDAGTTADASTTFGSGTLNAGVAADIALNNVQVNTNDTGGAGAGTTALGAETVSGQITATVDNMDGGGVSLSDNSATATSMGSQAYNAITAGGANTATFSGTVGIGSTQSNDSTVFFSEVSGNLIEAAIAGATGQTIAGSNVTVNGNTVGAYAGAGSVTNVISLSATTLSVGDADAAATLTAEREGGISDDAEGGAVVNNVQSAFSNNGATTSANNEDNVVELLASVDETVDSSDLALNGNTLEAIARSNNGSSSIALDGTTVTGSAGVLTVQTDDAGGTASVLSPVVLLQAPTGDVTLAVSGSMLELSGNLVRALSYGNDGGGSVALDATTFTLNDNGEFASTITVTNGVDAPFDGVAADAPSIVAQLAVLTDQELSGSVSAEANGTTPMALIVGDTEGNVTGSDLSADINAFVAAARGNVSENGITMQTTTTENSGEYEPAAAIGNIQTVEDGVDVTATATTPSSNTLLVSVAGLVDSSSVSADGNLLTAIAGGNYSTNVMDVSGTTLSDPAIGFPLGGALLLPTSATTSLVQADATYSITNAQFGGDGSRVAILDTLQNGEAAILVSIGAFDGDSVINSPVSASGNTLTASAVDNSVASAIGIDAVTFEASAAINNFQVSASDVSASTIGGDGHVGIEIETDGTVSGSTLTIDDTLFDADATANMAINILSAEATTMNDGSNLTGNAATFDSTAGNFATGTFALLNDQFFTDGTVTATALGSIVIDSASANPTITGSGLSASDNAQQAVGLGNTATNSIVLVMTDSGDVPPTASILSFQTNDTGAGAPEVHSTSQFVINTMGQVTDSSVSMDGNSNLALAIINDATNSLDVTAGAVLDSNSGTGGDADVDFVAGTLSATADYAVGNVQAATGEVSATTIGIITNNDSAGTVTTSGSVISLSNNTITADADANRASNTLSLVAGSTLGASGAISNLQSSDADVTSSATGTVAYDSGQAVNGSTVTANGNSTAAIGNGNVASNVLNATAGAGFTGGSTSASASSAGTALNANAQYAVLNEQINLGDVTATNSGGGISVTMGATGGVSGTSSTVSNNAYLAQATGNGVNNSVSMSGLTGGTATAAISSAQTNAGNTITASVSGVNMGITASGVTNVSLSASGNTITATATGNSAVNVITAQ